MHRPEHPLALNVFLGLAFAIPACSSSWSSHDDVVSPGNVEVIARLTQVVARGFLQDSKLSAGDSCAVAFHTSEDLRFVENAFLEALQRSSLRIATTNNDSSDVVLLDVQPLRVQVTYDRMFRDGIFGAKKVERSVAVAFSGKAVRYPGGIVVYSGTKHEMYRDTVEVRTLSALESPLIKVSQAATPVETFLDRILEPLVVLGATGIIIYLFYTVRT